MALDFSFFYFHLQGKLIEVDIKKLAKGRQEDGVQGSGRGVKVQLSKKSSSNKSLDEKILPNFSFLFKTISFFLIRKRKILKS